MPKMDLLLVQPGQMEQAGQRAERAQLLVRIECKTPRTFVVGRCENISVTGMLIKSQQTFEVPEAVTLRFDLPPPAMAGMVVQTNAVVVRAERGGFMAVAFVDLKPTHRQAIAKCIAQRKSPSA